MTDTTPAVRIEDFAYDLARALDREGLRDSGWTEGDIERAMADVPSPSKVSQKAVATVMPLIEKRIAALAAAPVAPAGEGENRECRSCGAFKPHAGLNVLADQLVEFSNQGERALSRAALGEA